MCNLNTEKKTHISKCTSSKEILKYKSSILALIDFLSCVFLLKFCNYAMSQSVVPNQLKKNTRVMKNCLCSHFACNFFFLGKTALKISNPCEISLN